MFFTLYLFVCVGCCLKFDHYLNSGVLFAVILSSVLLSMTCVSDIVSVPQQGVWSLSRTNNMTSEGWTDRRRVQVAKNRRQAQAKRGTRPDAMYRLCE